MDNNGYKVVNRYGDIYLLDCSSNTLLPVKGCERDAFSMTTDEVITRFEKMCCPEIPEHILEELELDN